MVTLIINKSFMGLLVSRTNRLINFKFECPLQAWYMFLNPISSSSLRTWSLFSTKPTLNATSNTL